jgi:hypothetical protein
MKLKRSIFHLSTPHGHSVGSPFGAAGVAFIPLAASPNFAPDAVRVALRAKSKAARLIKNHKLQPYNWIPFRKLSRNQDKAIIFTLW